MTCLPDVSDSSDSVGGGTAGGCGQVRVSRKWWPPRARPMPMSVTSAQPGEGEGGVEEDEELSWPRWWAVEGGAGVGSSPVQKTGIFARPRVRPRSARPRAGLRSRFRPRSAARPRGRPRGPVGSPPPRPGRARWSASRGHRARPRGGSARGRPPPCRTDRTGRRWGGEQVVAQRRGLSAVAGSVTGGGVRVGSGAFGAQQHDHRGRPEPQGRTACLGVHAGERRTQPGERRGPART